MLRRLLHALSLSLVLGAPALAQEWPQPAVDAEIAAAESWLEVDPPRCTVTSTPVAGWRIEVVSDREAGTATARAVAPTGRLAWTLAQASERVEVMHVGEAWRDGSAVGEGVAVLRAWSGGAHAGWTAIVLRFEQASRERRIRVWPGESLLSVSQRLAAATQGVVELARIDLGSGSLEVAPRAPGAPPDLRTRDGALADLSAGSTADAPRPLLSWRWDGRAYGCVAVDEPTTLPASSPSEPRAEDASARARRLGRIAQALYRGDVVTAADLARAVDPRGMAEDGFTGPAAWWRAIITAILRGPAWPALVRTNPALDELAAHLDDVSED